MTMNNVIQAESMTLTLDPTGNYKHADRADIVSAIGFIPYWLNVSEDLPASLAIDVQYGHGGGWRHFNGFSFDPTTGVLSYPEDPDLYPLAKYERHAQPNEIVYQYESGWVCVYNTESVTFEVARID